MSKPSLNAISLVLAVAACSGPSHGPASPSSSADIAIVDVTVIPVDRDGALAHQTVVVRGDRITAIGPAASTEIPAGARRIEGAGKFVIPGLADMHVHTYDPRELALFASVGVTSIRVMWGFPGTIGTRAAIEREKRLAPSIYTAGSIVDGDPPIWPGSTGVATVEQAREVVREQKRLGVDFVKVYSKLTPELYDAIVAEANKLGMPVMGHVPSKVGLAHALDAKQRSIEHLDGYLLASQADDSPITAQTDRKTAMGGFQYVDPKKLAAAIARTKAADAYNCPTLVVLDRVSHLDHPDTSRPELAYVSASSKEAWSPDKDFRFKSWTAKDFELARGMVAWQHQLVRQLAEGGAGIVAGTDVGNPWLVPGYSLHEELQLLVASGLTPLQALRAATTNAAALMRDREPHAIAVGARADLVLLDADPLRDIANTAKIAGVVLRGTWLPASELAAARAAIAEIYAGKRSRFADAPPPPAGARTARYRMLGFFGGEERLAVLADRFVGDSRLDHDVDTHWDVAASGDHITLAGDGFDIDARRAGGKVTITGRVGNDTVKRDLPIAEDEMLGGQALAADMLMHQRLMKLAVGESVTIKLQALQVSPTVGLQAFGIFAKREADAAREVNGKSMPVRVFTLSLGFRSSDLTLDEHGLPVTSETAQRLD